MLTKVTTLDSRQCEERKAKRVIKELTVTKFIQDSDFYGGSWYLALVLFDIIGIHAGTRHQHHHSDYWRISHFEQKINEAALLDSHPDLLMVIVITHWKVIWRYWYLSTVFNYSHFQSIFLPFIINGKNISKFVKTNAFKHSSSFMYKSKLKA